MLKSFFSTLPLLALLFSCQSADTLRPYPSRFTVAIPPLLSYTADYSLVPIPFDSLAKLALEDEIVEVDRPDKWEFPRITKYQNPVLPVQVWQPHLFNVVGEVERISYEPVKDVEDRIIAYAFGGLIGLALSDNEGAMAAYVQYRFSIKDARDLTIDTFLTIGISSADPRDKSRKELMSEANYFAAVEFMADVVLRIAKAQHLTLEHSGSVLSDPKQRIAKRREYFENKLKATIRRDAH